MCLTDTMSELEQRTGVAAKEAQWQQPCALILLSVVRIHPQLNFHSERGESLALSNSRLMNDEVWSHPEE